MAEQSPDRDRDLNQLRARVAELEAEVERRNLQDRASALEAVLDDSDGNDNGSSSSRGRRSKRSSGVSTAVAEVPASVIDASERASEVVSRKVDEGLRLWRALTLSSLQSVALLSDTMTTFVDDVLDRSRPRGERRVRELVADIPWNLQESARTAADRLREQAAERSPVDVFYDAYSEARPSRRSRTRASDLSVVSTSPANGYTGRAPSDVRVIFNREVEPGDHQLQQTMVVKKGDRTVRGSVRQPEDDELVWTPSSSLDEGGYTVSVSGVESPANGKSIVRLRQPFVLSFTVTATPSS